MNSEGSCFTSGGMRTRVFARCGSVGRSEESKTQKPFIWPRGVVGPPKQGFYLDPPSHLAPCLRVCLTQVGPRPYRVAFLHWTTCKRTVHRPGVADAEGAPAPKHPGGGGASPAAALHPQGGDRRFVWGKQPGAPILQIILLPWNQRVQMRGKRKHDF